MHTRRANLFVLSLATGLLASACSPTLEPLDIAATKDCPRKPFRGPMAYEAAYDAGASDELMIADFEDTTTNLVRRGQRDGSWTYGQESPSTGALAKTVVSAQCPADGKWAGQFLGSNFVDWGANWTANFHPYTTAGTPVPYDARAYGGISFWAAFGKANAQDFALPVGIATMDTAWNSPVCTPTKDSPDLSCSNHYMQSVPLTHDWQRFSIRFEDFHQDPNGGEPLTEMKRDQLVGIIVWPRPPEATSFDIWIDDLRFEP